MKILAPLLLLCLFTHPFTSYGEENYLTIEERNQIAQEDMRKMMEAFQAKNKAKQEGTYAPKQIDYSQYTSVFDFKNIFDPQIYHSQPKDQINNGKIWQLREKQRHQDYIAKIKADYIVVPIQDFSRKYGSTSTLYPTRIIALLLRKITGKKILPPELVYRTFYKDDPVFNESELFDSFGRTDATFICLYLKDAKDWKFKGDGRFFHELAVVVTDSSGTIQKQKIFHIDKVTEEHTLDVHIQKIIPDIISFVTSEHSLHEGSSQIKISHLKKWSGKGSFADIVATLDNPLDHSAFLQFIALITPEDFAEERKRLFERSLSALQNIDPSSEVQRLLRARALHYLHRRPQAMALFSEDDGPVLKALHEYLNGNYYGLKKAFSKIETDSPLLSIPSFLELDDLSIAYGKERPSISSIVADQNWKELILRTTGIREYWYSQDDSKIMTAINKILPDIEPLQLNVQEELRPRISQNEEEIATLYKEMLMQALGEAALDGATAPYSDMLVQTDIYRLFRNILADNIVRHLYKTVYLQGLYEKGVDFANNRNALLGGLPSFSYYHALGLFKLALQKSKHQQLFFLSEAREKTCIALNTAPSYTPFYSNAKNLLSSIRYMGLKSAGSDCGQWSHIKHFPSDQKGFKYEVADIQSLINAYEKGIIDEKQFKSQISFRFEGHPGKILWKADNLWNKGKPEKTIKYLNEKIREDRQIWGVYNSLGDYLFEMGRFQAASEAYFSYPNFIMIPSGQRVQIAGIAYTAGNRFFQAGRHKESIPFFKFSASIGTGSGSEMRSRFNLACIDGDYARAAEYAYGEWQRYESEEAFGNYTLMLQLLKFGHETEENLFSLIKAKGQQKIDYPEELWTAYLNELRIKSESSSAIMGKIAKLISESGSPNLKTHGYRAAFEAAFTDRSLTPSTSKSLLEIAPVRYTTPRGETLFSKIVKGLPKETPEDKQSKENQKSQKDFLRDYISLYAGVMYLQQKKYDTALKTFIEYDNYTPKHSLLDGSTQSDSILPFAVMAYLQSDSFNREIFDQIVLAKQKQTLNQRSTAADYLLEAFEHTTQNNLTKALNSLKKAPLATASSHSNLNWYQLILSAEWLFDYTGDSSFITLALDWVKQLQVTRPYLSWPYAFEALYGTEQPRRVTAAAFAWYLDKKSRWLEKVPTSIMDLAVIRWPQIQQELIKEDHSEKVPKVNT